MTEQQLRDECAWITAEWNLDGFVNGSVYEDFAVELAKRAVMAERNRYAQQLRDAAEILAPTGKPLSKFDRQMADLLTRLADSLIKG